MNTNRSLSVIVLSLLCAAPLLGQDSTSKSACMPGDALFPYDKTEQRNRFIVDLVTVRSSWGVPFRMAPIVKSGKLNSTLFNAGVSSQGISRGQRTNIPLGGTFDFWAGQGKGVNGDLSLNDPGIPFPTPSHGNQFSVVMTEFATTDTGAPYNGITTGVVQYDPADSSRLFVERIVTATTGCDVTSQVSSIALGAVNADGISVFRADGFNLIGSGSCAPALASLTASNIFMTNSLLRDATKSNVISLDYPNGLFDAPSTKWLVRENSTVHTTPGIANIAGTPTYIGLNFNSEYVRGAANTSIKTDNSFLATATSSTRGNISSLSRNHPALSSTDGLAACLGRNSNRDVIILNVWGLDATGDVSGALALTFPGTVTDAITGAKNLVSASGINEYDHYHSQTAFRGGNGQIAMNIDAAGDLLVTAVMDQPEDLGAAHNLHHLSVARVKPNGTTTWTMAAYNTSDMGPQKILDGPAGTAIGELTTLADVTGGTPAGPSFSGPMIDNAGNVLFYAAIVIYGTPDRKTTGLVRAVYDSARDGYELELVVATGDVARGANSVTDYQIQFVPLADRDSVDSATPWSQNIMETGYGGQQHVGVANQSSLHVGGLVFNAQIVYDVNGDGKFESCRTNAASSDQDYQVLMYLGAADDCAQDLGSQGPGRSTLSVCGQGFKVGETSTLRIAGAPANAGCLLFVSSPGGANFSLLGGTLVSIGNQIVDVLLSTNAQGEFSVTVPGAAGGSFVLQALVLDNSQPQGFAFTNAVQVNFGR